MHVTTEEKQSTRINLRSVQKTTIGVVGLITSIAVTLIAIFALTSWVEASGLHHAIQHVLIFTAGGVATISGLSLRKSGDK